MEGTARTQVPTGTNYDVGATTWAGLKPTPLLRAMEAMGLGYGPSWSPNIPIQVSEYSGISLAIIYPPSALPPSTSPMWDNHFSTILFNFWLIKNFIIWNKILNFMNWIQKLCVYPSGSMFDVESGPFSPNTTFSFSIQFNPNPHSYLHTIFCFYIISCLKATFMLS